MFWSSVRTTSSPATGGVVSDLAETITLPWGSVCIAIEPDLPDSTALYVASSPASPWASVPVNPTMWAAGGHPLRAGPARQHGVVRRLQPRQPLGVGAGEPDDVGGELPVRVHPQR